jgi:hypothetical protein
MIESNTVIGTGMKVVTQRDELAQKLGIVARAVSTRASVQILSGVLLRAEGGRLHLAATDMELSSAILLTEQVRVATCSTRATAVRRYRPAGEPRGGGTSLTLQPLCSTRELNGGEHEQSNARTKERACEDVQEPMHLEIGAAPCHADDPRCSEPPPPATGAFNRREQ